MTGEFMGPPWQMDWVRSARADRDALPEAVRNLVDEIRTELVTVKDPYCSSRVRKLCRPRQTG